MKQFNWKEITWEQCPECGNDVEVYSSSTEPNNVYDSEIARCVDIECYHHTVLGGVSINEMDNAYINWCNDGSNTYKR